MSAEYCPKCKGSGWIQPWGYIWDRHLGWMLSETAPPHQCADCYGTGIRREAREPAGRTG